MALYFEAAVVIISLTLFPVIVLVYWLLARREEKQVLAEFGDQYRAYQQRVPYSFHAYHSLIHLLTFRRTNHHNIHVRGYKEESTITTTFDMNVLNELDRFHLAMDSIDRLPQTGDPGVFLKQRIRDKLIEHRQYIVENGQDLPEIRDWRWGGPSSLVGAT